MKPTLTVLFLFLLSTTSLAQWQPSKLFKSLVDFIIQQRQAFVQPDTSPLDDEYDFVIIGAGSGGSVLANRLSEIANWKILLLEAGKEEIFVNQIPILASAWHSTDYNWAFKIEPSNNYCLAAENKRCLWSAGKVVGGTSSINFMVYSRGAPEDYDAWANDEGNPGWSYRDVLPYFLKSENSVINDQAHHSKGGPLDVSFSPYRSRLLKLFLESAKLQGYRVIRDYNTEDLMGFSMVQANIKSGMRVSASKAFLKPHVRARGNLRIASESTVTRIHVDPVTKIAAGVEFLSSGGNNNKIKTYVRARKEVLLCAGTLNSPKLLMLSGIGPADHLSQLGIRVVEDLPGVGRNLQDHVSMTTLTFLVNDTVTVNQPRLILKLSNTFDYFLRGTGPLTIPGGAEGIGFINTKDEGAPYDSVNVIRRRDTFEGNCP